MTTTIKVSKETKDRILSLDLAEKGKTFDMVVNDLITNYTQNKRRYSKDYKKWEKQQQAYEKSLRGYDKEKQTWQKLLKWARSQGFKG